MNELWVKIFFVAFVTAPMWASGLAYLAHNYGNSYLTDVLATFFGFVATQTAVWTLLFLLCAMMGGSSGFVSIWKWLFYGAGASWWFVSAIGFLASLFFEDRNDVSGTIFYTWVVTIVCLVGYWIILLIIAGVNAVAPILG